MKMSRSMNDVLLVSYYTGYVIFGTALLMLIPLLTSVLMQEWEPALDFIISFNIALVTGLTLVMAGRKSRNRILFQWRHGLIIASVSWFILMGLCAVPYVLSGHYLSLLDACFDVMSGFTTTGLTLAQDLDHLSLGLNMWRHVLTFVGGQGMVVLALTFLFRETGGAYKVYVGEAKDVELVPNVKGTARIIWGISMIYLLAGTIALWIVGMLIGLSPLSAFFHGLYINCSAWSTGGFAPMSQNVLYYHSFAYESVTLILFILGSLNFGLHYQVWIGNRKEITRNIETQSFMITTFIGLALCAAWLVKTGVYSGAVVMFRKIAYHFISAHTTTGFGTVYSRQFALEWGDFGVVMLIIAMLIGASACSTAGGIKGLRIGIMFKAVIADIQRMLSSERRVLVHKFHHMKDQILEDTTAKSAFLITVLYMGLFAVCTALAAWYGYPLLDSAFEAASITGNVGLSIGVTSASMPSGLKLMYIVGMYLARLEFVSVLTLAGFVIGGTVRACKRYLSYR